MSSQQGHNGFFQPTLVPQPAEHRQCLLFRQVPKQLDQGRTPRVLVVFPSSGQEALGGMALVETRRLREERMVRAAKVSMMEQGRIELGIFAGQLCVQLGYT